MNDNKTRAMLQRIPMILAVTAASYGLPLQARATQRRAASSHGVARPGAATPAAMHRRLAQRH